MRFFVSLAALLLVLSINAATAATATYHLANTYVLGGDGGWDYLTYDASTNLSLFPARHM